MRNKEPDMHLSCAGAASSSQQQHAAVQQQLEEHHQDLTRAHESLARTEHHLAEREAEVHGEHDVQCGLTFTTKSAKLDKTSVSKLFVRAFAGSDA